MKVSFEEELLIVIFKYLNYKIWRTACKMAVKSLSKHYITSQSLELATIIVIAINVVIGGFSGEDLK